MQGAIAVGVAEQAIAAGVAEQASAVGVAEGPSDVGAMLPNLRGPPTSGCMITKSCVIEHRNSTKAT